MDLHVRRFGWSAVLLAAVVATPAQLAQSPTFRVSAFTFDGMGSRTSSLHIAAHVAGDVSSTPMSSAQFTGRVGFLAANDPEVTNNPVLFGMRDDFGPIAGGSSFTIGGLNFEKFGSAPTLSVTIGGAPAAKLVVKSDTQITGTTPPGASGPQDIVIANSNGSSLTPGGYVYTPAIVTTPVAPIGSRVDITNYGDVGNLYWTVLSLSTGVAPTQYGTLLLGLPLIQVVRPTPYPEPLGIATTPLQVPKNPSLSGITVHFQSLSISRLSPLRGMLTNASSTFIP